MELRPNECAFYAEKLGMLFNIQDRDVTVVGLDSLQYKWTADKGLPKFEKLNAAPPNRQFQLEDATQRTHNITMEHHGPVGNLSRADHEQITKPAAHETAKV